MQNVSYAEKITQLYMPMTKESYHEKANYANH